MANLAQIQSIAQGQFFVKDSLGNLTELKVGDTVSLNDTIVAASSNTDLSKIEILFDTNELITLSQGEQLLDTTLLASTFGNEELAFDKQEVDETLNAWNNTQDGDATDMETAAGDVTEQATNAGDERAADGGALRSKFNSRDGDATDIVSDLREASWTDGIERTIEDSENMLLEQPLPVVYTIIEGIDVVNEGDSANYVVKLQDAAGNPVIATQDTIIYVRYTNKTTQDGDTQYNNENIIEVVIKAGTSQTEFTIKTNDDYLADNGEIYNVAITGNNSTEFDMRTGDVAGNKTNVDTTILDNSNPLNPGGEDGGYGSEDTVYVKISQPSEILEGGKLSHTVTLVDKDGNPVTIPAGEKIIVTLTYTSTDGVTDGDFSTIVKEVELVSNGTTFENTTIVDNTYEGSENYKVTITDVKQTNGTYENVAIHQTENSTTGKITDNPVQIVLVATDSTGTIPLKVDGTVDLQANKNSTPEGGKLYYVAVAVDKNGKPLDKQTGKVDVSYNNTSDTTDKDAILSGTGKDIKNNPTVVEIGKTFTVDAEDDYYAEGDEKFNVTISNPKDTGYDTGVSVKSGADTVTSTIKDNPADSMKPDTNTGTDNPDGGNYGKEDTVYVRIVQDSQTIEGGNLNHKIQLVDKDGKPVEIPAGEKITVKLQYTPLDGTNVNYDDFVNIREVEVTLDNSVKENGYYKVQITNKTQVDFYTEGTEKYKLEITGVSQEKNTYENITIDSKNSSVTGTIRDGITLTDPENTKVDEDDFFKGTSTTKSNLSSTKNLGFTVPANYETVVGTFKVNFVGEPTIGGVSELTSNGVKITYEVNGNTIVGKAGTTKVFDIVLSKDGTYTYKQYANIDHPKEGNANTDYKNVNTNDNINLNFEFNITTTPNNDKQNPVTSPTKGFTVTVNDSTPDTKDRIKTVNEDGTLTIVLSDEPFKDGKIEIDNGKDGYQTIAENGTVNIYDGDKIIGTLTNNANGTLTFKPNADYSKYEADNGYLPNFKYKVSDTDGDYAEATVSIKVKPVTDGTEIKFQDGIKVDKNGNATLTTFEDTKNTAEGKDSVSLGLKIPTIKDNTDKNSGAKGDHGERVGDLVLKFTNGNLVNGAKLLDKDGNPIKYKNGEDVVINTRDQVVKIVIINENGSLNTDFHHSNVSLTEETTIYMTQTQYESIKINHAEDNDTDIKINISTKTYEVNDSGERLSNSQANNQGKTDSKTMTVVIKPITDNIELKWDNNKVGQDEIGTISSDGKTFVFNDIKEDESIDLKNLLSNTSGALNGEGGTKADLDGSEKRTYTISGIPAGTVVTLDGQTAIANTKGVATLVLDTANNQKLDHDSFKMQFPNGYSGGTVEGKITLSVRDKGFKSNGTTNEIKEDWGEVKTAEVNFKVNVTPVADDATVKVGQPVGYEDAGREGGNTKDKSGAITNPIKGIVLPITVTSTDKDGSETFTVTIKDIPNGSGLYVYDKSSKSYKLVEVSNDGTKITIDGVDANKSGNISVTLQQDGKFAVEIKDYQNALKDGDGKYIIEEPKFIPPHNTHGDFPLKVDVKTVDTSTINGNLVTTENQTVTDMVITVVVKDVADFVVGNEYKTEELVLADNSKKSYNTVANEDEVINLKSIFTDSTKLSSYDKESEDLTIIIKDLPAGITLEGSVTLINGQYIFKASDIPNIKIVTPQNYSGELNFKIDYITTEAGKETKNPSKTFDSNKKTTDSVSIFVKPTVDAGFKSNTTKAEDIQAEKVDGEANSYYKLDLGISHKNGDNDETLVSVTIDKPANGDYILVIKGANGTYTEITDFTKTYTEAELKNIYVQAPENKHGSFDIKGTYTVKDSHYGATNSNYVATKTDDFKHTLNITPVTDKPTIAVEDGVQTKIEVISGEAKTIEIPIKVTSSDKDGSENITKIVISGVPQGVTISFGDAELDAKVTVSEHNGIYTIVPKDGNYKLNDADFKNITFNVTSSANFEHRNITITSYTQDAAGSSEESTSTVITLDKTHNGNGGGNGSGIGIELKDGNPYQTTEDTEFNFLDVFIVADGGSDGRVTLNFTLDSTNATIKGLTANANGSYTITGNRADIESVLANLKVVPNKDYNDNHTTDKGTLDITVTIDGKTPVTAKVPVTPVTDSGVITITPVDSATTIDENGEFKFDIKFENNVDIGTTLKDNVIYIKANENYKDSNESSTGKLYYIDNLGNKVELDADGKFELKDGYTIDNLPKFVYEAGKNRNGDVSITVSTENKESNADNYTLATGSTSITVQPVVSSEIKVEKVQDGIEDGQMASVKLSVDKYDPSEKFESVLIKVASGVAVYHGSNGSSLAMNVGDGSWLIPVSGDGKTLPEIFFKGKEHLGGEIEFTATINAKDGEAKVTKELTGSVTITEVADGVTIDPTKTGIDKNAFEWTSLNLNANMKDLDGSEKMHFTLEGLDSSAQFRIVDKDGNITDLSSQSKFENGKWTINGIEYEDINNIQITHDKSVKDIKVEAWTQDGQDADISNKVEGKFDLNFTQDALKDGTLTLGKEMNIDFSKIESGDIKDVSTIDLGAQGENKLLNLTLQDVMDIGKKDGGNINLTILGDSQDKVSFADKSQWQKSETTIIENGKTFTQWSNTSDSTVTLKIEQPISDGITN